MTRNAANVVQEIVRLTEKAEWGKYDSLAAMDLLTELASAAGYSNHPNHVSWEDGLYVLAKVGSEAAPLLIRIAKKFGGKAMYEQVAYALLELPPGDVITSLRVLIKTANHEIDRRAVQAVLDQALSGQY